VRQIDFNELPRSTRERFVRSLVSSSPISAPICSRIVKRRSATVWYLLLAASLLALAGLAIPSFGSILAPVQDRRFLAGYVVACAVLGLSLACIAKRRALAGSLPFAPGVYVFPLDLVDARTRELALHPMSDLISVEPVHHQKKGVYTHSVLWLVFPADSFTFEVKSREKAEAIVARLQEARLAAIAATQRNELLSLASIDPFTDARARNFEPAHDHGLLARDAPIWTHFVWAITIVSGLVLGVAAWRVRNWQSDARAFARLLASPDEATADAYVAAGGLRVADVKSTVVPRARLDAAKAETGEKRLEALDRFLRDHPGSAFEAEARAALTEALHAHFLAQTTVGGLRAFVARWPSSPDVPVARAKIAELFRATIADFRQHANTSDKAVVPVVEALLAWAEAHDDPVEVRFRRRAMTSLPGTEYLLGEGLLEDGGPVQGGNARLAPHFLVPPAIAARDAMIVAGLGRSLRGVFPADVIALRAGPPLEETAEMPLPEVTAPTFVVDYEIGWTGATYVARDRARRFVGLYVNVDVAVQVPREPRVLSFSLRVDPPETLPIHSRPAGRDGADVERDDERVYDAMLLRAFEDGAASLLPVFFEPSTAEARAPRQP